MIRYLAGLILFTAVLSQADEAADRLTAAGVVEFAAAYRAWDGERFGAAAELCRQATTNGAASSTNFYWLGVAHFHHMLQLQSQPAAPSNTLAAAAAMAAALAALEQAVKLSPRAAEIHALLGTLYGMKIGGSLIRGAKFGPRVAQHSKQALENGANNPRVQYLLGTCQFHTAKKAAKQREALTTFLQAEKLFEAEAKTPAGPLDPRWGYDTCLTFIGRTYERLSENGKAADYYRKALARHPEDHLAKEGLGRLTKRK
jgi:tetratricopeptide (TPR) repeat protein